MKSTKDKLKELDRNIQKKWKRLEETEGISTREKLERLVQAGMRRSESVIKREEPPSSPGPAEAFEVRNYLYPLEANYKRIQLKQWAEVTPSLLELIGRDSSWRNVDPGKLVFFDTETTGLAGGTGTVPFLLGFGYFTPEGFRVTCFLLSDLNREGEFLDAVDAFLEAHAFSGLVTFNGRSFDLPLMEARYILQRKRSPLSRMAHLDFLYPARVIWRNTFESRRLGYLADMLLEISRDDDIDAAEIPALYFEFIRTRLTSLLDSVIEHNALDLLGLAGLLLLAALYLKDYSLTMDEGEILGVASLFECMGDYERAEDLYRVVKEISGREPLYSIAVKRLARLLKKRRLFHEAVDLWKVLAENREHLGFRELSVHFEHREKNPARALEFVEQALAVLPLSGEHLSDMEKRMLRLKKKLNRLTAEENGER